MLGIFKKMFSGGVKEKTSVSGFDKYFQAELVACSHIKPESRALVMDHLHHRINLNKTGNKLTADEKRTLNINTRLSITRELVDILTESGLQQPNPKDILSSIYYRATFAKTHDENLKQFRKMGLKHYEVLACRDERDCPWCKSMDGKKVSVSQNFNDLINDNCTCESHCRLSMLAVIK